VLSYVAVVLEYPDEEIVVLALDILETFVKNVENYNHITSTFGIREALDAVINKYNLDDLKLAKRAQQIKDDIERMKPPIYNLRSRCRRVIEPKKLKTHVIVLHVHGLLPVSLIHNLQNLLVFNYTYSFTILINKDKIALFYLCYKGQFVTRTAFHIRSSYSLNYSFIVFICLLQ
jgi:hypothetical protein